MKRAIATALLAGVAVAVTALGLAATQPEQTEIHETSYVFGTLVEFTIRTDDEAAARRAIAAVDRDFRRMHTEWHAWKAGGELAAINRAFGQGEAAPVTPFVRPLIEQARTYERLSGGLFNPAIGNLLDVWGFHADVPEKGRLPDFARVRALAAARPSMEDVRLEGDSVVSANRDVSLDFGGFAKGVALDMAVAKLRTLGVDNAIVNAGGDLNTIGTAGERPWTVGIRDPRDWGVIASVQLHGGENLYTSGNYERFIEADGVRYAHILDPRTGWPVEHIISASVIHTDGALADAAATALSVAGPDAWSEVARRMGLAYVMLVDKSGTVYASPEMLARIVFETDKTLDVVTGPALSDAPPALSGGVELSHMRQADSDIKPH